jgi:hypothetical protein
LPEQKPPTTILGQSLGQSSGNARAVEEALSEPAPYPQGLADASMIDPKLVYDDNPAASSEMTEKINISPTATGTNPPIVATDKTERVKPKSEKGVNGINGILLLATIVSMMMLIYTVVIAFDYHQRWMQSLTAQNNRFSGLPDDEPELDADFSGKIPLYGGTSNGLGLSTFRSESQYY